ncbi:hypothetical protein ABLN82_20315 [Mycobacterium tuberculosis]
MAWKMGCSSGNAHTIATVAAVPAPALRPGYAGGAVVAGSGWVTRGGAGEGFGMRIMQLAGVATVNQLRTALKLEPRPETRTGFSAGTAALDHQERR